MHAQTHKNCRSKGCRPSTRPICNFFDEWVGGDTHYVSVLATFPSKAENGYDRVFLACSPMENEGSLDAYEHKYFLTYVLSVFGKSMESVVAVVVDNCFTNRAIERKIGAIFVGCYSHRYNLEIKDILCEFDEAIEQVHKLMKKLSYQIPAPKLRALIPLKAVCANVTRWSSTFHMLRRYDRIREFILQINDSEVGELIPDDNDHEQICELLAKLTQIDSVTVELQDDSTAIADARCLFDAVIRKYPSTKSRLMKDAEID